MIKLTKIPYSFTSQIFGKSFRGLNWKKLSLKLGLTLSYFVVFVLIYLIILSLIITDFGINENTNFDNSSNSKLEKFDTIILLGAGLIDNSVSPVLIARIDHTLDLYQKGASKSIIFTGGIGQNQVISEGEGSFNYAIKSTQNTNQDKNSPKSEINSEIKNQIKHNFFFEKSSKTTKQNLSEAKQITKQNNLETAIIVSDSLHIFRTN